MGQSCSNAEVIESRKISKLLIKERDTNHQLKLLLLGAGLAGKSTIFKQVAILYSKGFDEKARENYVPAITGNVIEIIKTLIFEAQKREQELSPQGSEKSSELMKLGLDDPLTPAIGEAINFLWQKEKAIKEAYESRSSFVLGDNASYFLENILRICTPGYLPTEQDVLRVRVRTSSIVEMPFSLNGFDFLILDVGGQRGERRKWIHCFDGVKAVLFVVGVSEYDQKVPEDPTKNSLLEALELFGNVCNLDVFEDTSMILFLNKSDIFKEKLENKVGDLRNVFPSYEGGYDFDKAINFIARRFLDVRENKSKDIYHHVTCATNKDNISFVFSAVQDIIIRLNLSNCEL